MALVDGVRFISESVLTTIIELAEHDVSLIETDAKRHLLTTWSLTLRISRLRETEPSGGAQRGEIIHFPARK